MEHKRYSKVNRGEKRTPLSWFRLLLHFIKQAKGLKQRFVINNLKSHGSVTAPCLLDATKKAGGLLGFVDSSRHIYPVHRTSAAFFLLSSASSGSGDTTSRYLIAGRANICLRRVTRHPVAPRYPATGTDRIASNPTRLPHHDTTTPRHSDTATRPPTDRRLRKGCVDGNSSSGLRRSRQNPVVDEDKDRELDTRYCRRIVERDHRRHGFQEQRDCQRRRKYPANI